MDQLRLNFFSKFKKILKLKIFLKKRKSKKIRKYKYRFLRNRYENTIFAKFFLQNYIVDNKIIYKNSKIIKIYNF